MRGLVELPTASNGCGRTVGATPHPTPFHGATFSRKGRRQAHLLRYVNTIGEAREGGDWQLESSQPDSSQSASLSSSLSRSGMSPGSSSSGSSSLG